MYDDAEDQFFQQGYPSSPKPGRPVFASIIASVITTIVMFFLLRALDRSGAMSTPAAPVAAGVAQVAPSAAPSTPAGSVQIPSVVGMQLEQAREVLKARNLLISIKEERSEPGRTPGSVLAQAPLAGSDVQAGTTVDLVTARTVASLVVPPVVGQKVEDAIVLLASQGLKLGPQKPGPAGTVAAGLVAGSDPAPGSSVSPGSTVSLLVASPVGVAVPKVVGFRLTRARKVLEEAGFKLGRSRYKYDPCCGENVILEQTPPADEPAAPGTTIDVIVNEPG